MFTLLFSRFFGLLISFSLLVAPLPLSAIAQDVVINLSESEMDSIAHNSDGMYLYLGKELSDIAHVIARISCLDKDENSLVHKLKKHIDNGYFIADYNAIVDTLAYAETIIQKHSDEPINRQLTLLYDDFKSIVQKIINGELTIDCSSLERMGDSVRNDQLMLSRAPHMRTLVVNENMIVLGKAVFKKHLQTKQGIHADGKLKVGKSAEFKKNVKIKGSLSVADLTVASCVDSLCVQSLSVGDESLSGTLSANDAIITSATINTLSVNDAVIQDLTVITTVSVLDSIINNLTVFGTLSSNDAIMSNTTIINSSVTNEVVQNLSVVSATIDDIVITNCITNLCVNNLSVVDEWVSGTLSVNNEVVQNLSATDSALGNVSAVNLSVIDETITGTLSVNDAIVENFLRFQDGAGTAYVGITSSTIVPTSYTVALPSTIPTAHQVLRANNVTPTNLEWATEGGSVLPVASKTIYVAKYGNDITGDGSFNNPYATLSQAITIANGIASAINPIVILVQSGIYIENNSVGPLILTAAGISIAGDSTSGVIIMPNTPANNLLLINNTVRISDITFQSAAPLATGISLTTGTLSVFSSVRIINFLIGVNCAGGVSDSYGFNSCLFVSNSTAMNISNSSVECNNSTFFGVPSIVGPAANTGFVITGSTAKLVINGGVCGLFVTAFNIGGNSIITISDVGFRLNTFDIVQAGASSMVLSGCTFELTGGASDVDVAISGAGTVAQIIGCEFNGDSVSGTPEGIGVLVSDNAFVTINSSSLRNYSIGIQAGISTDAASTSLATSSLVIRNCNTDIVQEGSASLQFNASTASSSKITINDSTNVELAFFDLDDNGALTIGSTADQNSTLVQAAITPTIHPGIDYRSSLYSTQAVGLDNPLVNPTSWFIASQDNADLTAVTTDRTKIAGVQLYSDEGPLLGGTTALRGWDINKNASTAELSFAYQNSDIVGQIAIPEYTVMQIDGFNNQLQLPTAGTQIVFDGDTNLYRSGANVLQTDDNFIVGTLTSGRAVVTDAVTNELASSVATGTEVSYLSGVTSSIQTQINSKVAKAGDIMTGTLQLPAGTTALPSLVFTGSTTTGLSAPVANSLSFSTNGAERINIGSTGIVAIDGFTTVGVVHNDASGNLLTSLIVNADITDATISNAKLATISSTNTSGNIVVRDITGNFAANMITLTGAVVNPTDTATKSYVDAAISLGLVAKTPARVVSITNVPLSGLQTIDSVALNTNDRVLLVNQTNAVQNGLWLAQVGAWTRPADFASGTEAGQAYVLITSGAVEAGSSWLCNTPTAVIDTDPIGFSLFTLPGTTTGANVGAGTGLVFRDKTGITLNFRSLIAGTHLTITNNADDITFTTDATNSNTASTIVARDASGNFSAGTITASLMGSASNNVLKIGDTMTGALQLPAGTTLAPSLIFTGSTTTGLSANSGNLSFSTNALERMAISAAGIISVDAFTTAGVVHNDASGNLSSSLIVNADVDPAAAIIDSKLATISTAGKVANSATTATSLNTASTIVARDASGNFSAGTIIANLSGSASNNVLKSGDTMTGTLQLPAGTTAAPSLVFTGSTTAGLSTSAGALSFSTNALERLQISSGGTISVDAFTSAGIVHNDSSGNLSSSLIVNADVDPAAAIADSKLATISTTGKVANSATTATSANTANTIVLRNASGNFSAGLVSLTDEVVSNSLTVTPFTVAGVVHNNASGLLSSSLIVNADIDPAAAIADSKLATISTAGKVANSATTGVVANTANTLVLRDAAGSTSLTDSVVVGNLILTTDPSSSTAGNVFKGSNRFIHDFGTSNLFIGTNSGNFTMTGTGQNLGVGANTLKANTTGINNLAVGLNALAANTTGTGNTAVGINALPANVQGTGNTAVGFDALLVSTGSTANTAVGSSVLSANTGGAFNTGIGTNALISPANSSFNTAVGSNTLAAAGTGSSNVAIGTSACQTAAGSSNVVIGAHAATSIGSSSVIIGASIATTNGIGSSNVVIGAAALPNGGSGTSNIIIGTGAGGTFTFTGQNNIYLANGPASSSETGTMRIGTAGTQTSCFIAGINGVTTGLAGAVAVLIDGNGQLGTISSSRNVKHTIADMNDKSSDVLKLRPVTFAYNSDDKATMHYGLIAEEVDEIFPAIVVKDQKGQPETVQYHVLPVLLLNEVKKQQVTIDDLTITVDTMNNAINSLQLQIQSFVDRIKALEAHV